MDVDIKTVLFLVIFIVIGIALFSPIIGIIAKVTCPGHYVTYTTVSGTETLTCSSFSSNPEYVGSSNATLVSIVPIFYLIVLVIVPAVVAYKVYKE